MKKIILLLALVFIISFVSAEQQVYDYCNDSSVNTNLWNWSNGTATETTYLDYSITKASPGTQVGDILSTSFPDLKYLKNITFNSTLSHTHNDVAESGEANVYVFGNYVKTISGGTNNSIYTIRKNVSLSDLTFDVYINNRFTVQINATDNKIGSHLFLFSVDGTTDTSYFRISNVTYFYEEPDINYSETFVYETSREYYNYTVWSSSAPTMNYLNYSGTLYSATATSLGSNLYSIGTSLDLPSSLGIKYFNFIWNNGSNQISSNHTQSVSTINLSYCDQINNVPFVNYTFKNETAGMQSVSASISSASFNYYLGSGTVNKTLTYSNTTQASSRSFCFSPSIRTVYTTENINYYNTESLQRTYTSTSTTLSSTVTSKTLWLLPTSSGIYVSFQVVDGSIQPIENALVTISRSGYGTIGIQQTDASGLATFFLDPLASYTISAYKYGYTTFSESITPTQTSYTINLGSGSLITTPTDYTKGIDYSFTPISVSLNNGTTYNFTFTLDSDYFDVSSYGFNVTNSSGVSLGYNSSSTLGTVTLQLNVGNSDWVKVNAFWLIDSNYTNVTKTYRVFDSDGSEFSIWRFFTDLKAYLSNETDPDGLFGLKNDSSGTNFSLSIIIYIIIFSIAGVMSYKFGLNSPAAISAFIFTACLFFEYTTGLLDVLPNNDFPILSVTTLVMTIALVIREVTT